MATTVRFYNYSKKGNSTAVPSLTDGTAIDCFIKENTSTYNPTFIIESSSWPSFTYAYWNPYFYFVNDIVSIGNSLYEVSCSIDALGSWRSDILNSSQFVNRSASEYNVWMKDIELSNEQRTISTAYAHTSIPYFGAGTYILRTIGGASGDNSGITTYAMSESQLKVALAWLFYSNNTFDALWDGAVKAVFNPFQYIVALKYTPISVTSLPSAGTTSIINFGWWSYTTGTPVTILEGTGTAFPDPSSPITLAKPTTYFNDFRDYDPDFTEYRLTLFGGRTVTLPSIIMSQTLKVSCICDIITNKGILELSTSNGYYTTFDFDCCADIQISQTAADTRGVVGNTGSAISSAIAKHPSMLGASLAGAVTSLLQPIPSISGGQGNITSLRTFSGIDLTAIRYGSGSYPTTRLGRVLNAQRTLLSLSGFCKCSEAAVDCNAPINIKNQIEATLNTGFYVE